MEQFSELKYKGIAFSFSIHHFEGHCCTHYCALLEE